MLPREEFVTVRHFFRRSQAARVHLPIMVGRMSKIGRPAQASAGGPTGSPLDTLVGPA
jgi:hypothetical protein